MSKTHAYFRSQCRLQNLAERWGLRVGPLAAGPITGRGSEINFLARFIKARLGASPTFRKRRWNAVNLQPKEPPSSWLFVSPPWPLRSRS